MNRIVSEASVENPMKYNLEKVFPRLLSLLIVSLRDDGSKGRALSLPRQHLVLNLPDFLLEIPGFGWDGLPD